MAMPDLLDQLGVPAHLRSFEATHKAAWQRLGGISPAAYARSRNCLDGSVTGLSPYFTHGLVSMADAARAVNKRHALSFDDKLVFEFGWREFFQHVWAHQKNPDAILQDMHGVLPWHGKYAEILPQDIRRGSTGVPAIDNAVRILYATGYLHNHMRMWLASYVVHIRKVSWRAGADWLYGHLLDGDLPSNHLSWQWVAGTFSSKPYLFNAENVLKYAPLDAKQAWNSSRTAIDQSYEALEVIARQRPAMGAELGKHPAIDEPALLTAFYSSNRPIAQFNKAFTASEKIANKNVQLIHPWSLSERQPTESGTSSFRLGVIHLPAHQAWPWSERRWQFVLDAMAAVTDDVWIGDISQLDLRSAASVSAQACLFPAYRDALRHLAVLSPQPRLLPDPTMACRSFSKFYERARRDVSQLSDLL